jgi:hypothetical protein
MNRFQRIDSASLCSLAGRYDNPIPTRFLALIDCLTIPVLNLLPFFRSPGIDSQPGGPARQPYLKYRPTSRRNLGRPMGARNWVGLEPSRNQVGTNSGIVPPLPIKFLSVKVEWAFHLLMKIPGKTRRAFKRRYNSQKRPLL